MSDPWSRRIPCAAEQLSPRTTSLEPVLQSPGAPAMESMCRNSWSQGALEPVLHKKSHRNEKPAHRS